MRRGLEIETEIESALRAEPGTGAGVVAGAKGQVLVPVGTTDRDRRILVAVPSGSASVAALSRAGETHATPSGHECAVSLRGPKERPLVIAVPDPAWRRWTAFGALAVAGLGLLVFGSASPVAIEASRYAARSRAGQGGAMRRGT